ncbi:MAG TPA: lysylphosphatidylglycerol synthase domain-containing protein [Gammaproteobacteria bacterium]
MNFTWKNFFAVLLTVSSLYFLVTVLVSQWSVLREDVEISAVLLFVIAAIPIYVVTTISSAVAWTFAFRATGEKLALLTGLRVHLVSQVGKYIPGNIGHFVGRLGLLKLKGLSVAHGSVSIVLEILWMIGATAALSLYALFTGALASVGTIHGVEDWLPALVLMLALIVPNLMILFFNLLPEGLRRKLGFAGKIRRPPERVVLGCYALYFLNSLLNGLLLFVGAYWLFGVMGGDVFFVVSLYAVTWLLGFIVPGAPGGIGVREALFVLLFGGLYGAGVAAVMAVVLRVVSVLGDLVAFGLGYFLSRRRPVLTA